MRSGSWSRATRASRCPICGRDRYCTVNVESGVVRCTRTPSDKESRDRNGGIAWVHRLDGSEDLPEFEPVVPEPKMGRAEVQDLAHSMFCHRGAEAKREVVGKSLKLPAWSLYAMRVGVGWHPESNAEFSSWPCRDHSGHAIGITCRYADGSKYTYKRTSNGGLFIPAAPLSYWRDATVWVVEGGSDTAACVAAGIPAIGRPSNIGGVDVFNRWLACHPVRNVIVWGENDAKEVCPVQCEYGYCPCCHPGEFGAYEFAKRIRGAGVTVQFPPNPHKDIRSWLSIENPIELSVARFPISKHCTS